MIVKRGTSYGVSVYDPSAGQKRWIGTFATKAEAKVAEREAAIRPRGGGRFTCAEFAQVWLRDYARQATATHRTYRYALKPFVAEFGRRKLTDIDKPTARAWATKARSSNVRVVRTMYNDAITDGIHPGPNPFADLRLQQSRGRKDIVALTPGEVQELVNAACVVHELTGFGEEFAALIQFAAYVGLRPGELFALRPADVRKRELRIARAMGSTGELKMPKNGKARTVVLPPPAKDALTYVRMDREWLFCSPRGKQLSKNSLIHWWRPVRAAAGKPTLAFYELRHFCATYLLERGLSPADVAVQLGHQDNGALVMSTYGHPSQSLARERIFNAFSDHPSFPNQVEVG